MGITVVRKDITKMKVDAIVNSANTNLNGGGGVDGAIHTAAGPELDACCATLGGCEVGEAKLTPGFNLPAKYIIHTVGPVWRGGAYHEKMLLASCYLRSLELANNHNCKSIAFPLISSGAYGYPYEQAWQIAYDTCTLFLKIKKVKMDIYIVRYHGPRNHIGRENRIKQIERENKLAFQRVAKYIKDNYAFSWDDDNLEIAQQLQNSSEQAEKKKSAKRIKAAGICYSIALPNKQALNPVLKPKSANKLKIDLSIGETFSQMLLRFMNERNMKAPQLYNDACVDRKLFSKIKTNNNYQPKKYIAVCFALALKLSLEDTKKLLESAGYALSRSNFQDLVISSCIEQNIRTVWEVNEMLEEWKLPLLVK